MQCLSCGKEIPDQSTFCLHCGTLAAPSIAPVSMPVSQAPVEWEYQDFVQIWPPGRRGWICISDRSGYTIPEARIYFWQETQAAITKELQKWLDDGWEPVGEVGPSAIQLRTYKSATQGTTTMGGIMLALFVIMTFGLGLIFVLLAQDTFVEPTEFRVTLRRPKAPAS